MSTKSGYSATFTIPVPSRPTLVASSVSRALGSEADEPEALRDATVCLVLARGDAVVALDPPDEPRRDHKRRGIDQKRCGTSERSDRETAKCAPEQQSCRRAGGAGRCRPRAAVFGHEHDEQRLRRRPERCLREPRSALPTRPAAERVCKGDPRRTPPQRRDPTRSSAGDGQSDHRELRTRGRLAAVTPNITTSAAATQPPEWPLRS